MNQQQFFKTETSQRHGVCNWIKPETNFIPEKKEKEEMVEIPVLGTIDSVTGKITFYNNNNKKL
ncbi:MAG TPA: hypothetical protein VMV95_01045 [Bacillota bacterium]|nr:hypothetical protein [Bacillota bacterium]